MCDNAFTHGENMKMFVLRYVDEKWNFVESWKKLPLICKLRKGEGKYSPEKSPSDKNQKAANIPNLDNKKHTDALTH